MLSLLFFYLLQRGKLLDCDLPFKNWICIVPRFPAHFAEVPENPPTWRLEDSVGEPSISSTSSKVIPTWTFSKLAWLIFELQALNTAQKKMHAARTTITLLIMMAGFPPPPGCS
jgi:hypothetical protein